MDIQKILTLANEFHWDRIPFKNLSMEDLKTQSPAGETLIHKLALNNKLNLLPEGILCEELLLQKNLIGDTAYLYLAKHQNLDILPKHLITKTGLLEPNLRGDTALERVIEFNKLEIVDPNLVKEGILLETFRGIATFLHLAAMMGELEKIPQELWIGKLGLKDTKESTLLHWAAEGKTKDFPICKESLNLTKEQNINGETFLHKAQLSLLPSEYLTKETLSIQDRYGDTPLHRSAWTNSTTYLPIKHLTERLLTIENKKGESTLYMIIMGYQKQRDEKNLKEILKIPSKETLLGIKGLYIGQESLDLIVNELNTRKILDEIRNKDQNLEI